MTRLSSLAWACIALPGRMSDPCGAQSSMGSVRRAWWSSMAGCGHPSAWRERSIRQGICGFVPVGETDRSVQLALSAAVEAADQAGISGGMGTVAVIAGTSRGPQQHWDVARAELDSGRRLRPTMAATGTIACLSGLLAQQLGATGPGFTVSATCSSGAVAIALAAQQLLLGEADAVVAGGSDAPVHPLVLRGLESAGMLGSACRPFDARRDGLVIGEGAGFLVLERERDARRRGATVLARLEGWATGVDGLGRTGIREDGSGLVDVLGRALGVAGIQAREVGYINAHGTATELNDRVRGVDLGGGVWCLGARQLHQTGDRALPRWHAGDRGHHCGAGLADGTIASDRRARGGRDRMLWG